METSPTATFRSMSRLSDRGKSSERRGAPFRRLPKARALLVLLQCCACVGCGIYENSDHPNYGWGEFHGDQATCQSEHSRWVETGNMGAMEDRSPGPSVVDACLATKGWHRTDAFPELSILFPRLAAGFPPMPP
jgi:hypothetical protein